jgi:hypothetical protein
MRRQQLLDNRKKTREPWKLQNEAQDLTLRGNCFGSGYGSFVKQSAL